MSRAPLASVLAMPLLAFGLALGLAPEARAQNISPEQAKALRTACEADVKKLCAGVQPGGGRLVQCLKEHKDEVTPPCQASLGALAASLRKQ
ncbi:cysteine rich repeat-containing protein [Xanthobacter autotrophicus]|uniref:cysteine rich repeat-containing protein n=1 Tax=Xanthobacter TaxID=279 RepID=UPI0024AA3B7D|nr:cysteine rich repeat-containing protein [Xanthobacter autotrophicus]MDI4663446.1 cysteine rich repeat-containing protein [Xanthobacter autotrophicus]